MNKSNNRQTSESACTQGACIYLQGNQLFCFMFCLLSGLAVPIEILLDFFLFKGGGEKARHRHVSRGKLLPREKINKLDLEFLLDFFFCLKEVERKPGTDMSLEGSYYQEIG